jgi:hypothetical protein
MGLDTKTYWLTDRQLQCNFDFDFDFEIFSRPISLLSTTGKLFEKVIPKLLQKHIEEKACLMPANLVSVHVTARHYNVWG